MKMSANRNDRVVDHPTRSEGQWNAIRAVTRLVAEYPELVSPPSRTPAHNMQISALPLSPARMREYNKCESLECGSLYVAQGSLYRSSAKYLLVIHIRLKCRLRNNLYKNYRILN
jgi:hypothetical protein